MWSNGPASHARLLMKDWGARGGFIDGTILGWMASPAVLADVPIDASFHVFAALKVAKANRVAFDVFWSFESLCIAAVERFVLSNADRILIEVPILDRLSGTSTPSLTAILWKLRGTLLTDSQVYAEYSLQRWSSYFWKAAERGRIFSSLAKWSIIWKLTARHLIKIARPWISLSEASSSFILIKCQAMFAST